jgi:hypothetical protein
MVPASAQVQAPKSTAANGQLADLIKDWQTQKEMLLKVAEAMPVDKFAYKPTPQQRTFGEQILHIAIGNVELISLLGTKRPRPFNVKVDSARPIPESAVKATKEEIVAMLSKAYDFGTAVLNEQTPASINLLLNKDTVYFGASTRARVVWSLLSHAMDIYGQMVVYLRLNGIVPPASRAF